MLGICDVISPRVSVSRWQDDVSEGNSESDSCNEGECDGERVVDNATLLEPAAEDSELNKCVVGCGTSSTKLLSPLQGQIAWKQHVASAEHVRRQERASRDYVNGVRSYGVLALENTNRAYTNHHYLCRVRRVSDPSHSIASTNTESSTPGNQYLKLFLRQYKKLSPSTTPLQFFQSGSHAGQAIRCKHDTKKENHIHSCSWNKLLNSTHLLHSMLCFG